jgi:hypothetical protein
MPHRIALVSCVKSKKNIAAPAADLYTSPLFRFLRQYAEANADGWYILSAEHGLLHPDTVIDPYERTLNRMGSGERLAWAHGVQQKLLKTLPPDAEIIVLAGSRYREHLIPFLKARGFSITVPLEGLSFGKQLQRLKEINSPSHSPLDSASHGPLDRFYDILGVLAGMPGQGRPLGQYSGGDSWPDRGVYFFLEPGEFRRNHPSVSRVVRVGTHAVSAGSQSNLWGRLRAHRGAEDGSGNHRGSIFRSHVGAALLKCSGTTNHSPQWGTGASADATLRVKESGMERRVSDHIARMRVLWVPVDDPPGRDSMRAFIERNSIALLSNRLAPVDPPGSNWLGLHSPRKEIRASGLWNLNHVVEEVDLSFLDVLEAHVQAAVDGSTPSHSPRRRDAEPAAPEPIREARPSRPTRVVPGAETKATGVPFPTRISYAARSSFFGAIDDALEDAGDRLTSGRAVEVILSPQGYDGEYLVRIDARDQQAFGTDWIGTDETRFPARIRAAATVLGNRGDRGVFRVSHVSGRLAITGCSTEE